MLEDKKVIKLPGITDKRIDAEIDLDIATEEFKSYLINHSSYTLPFLRKLGILIFRYTEIGEDSYKLKRGDSNG